MRDAVAFVQRREQFRRRLYASPTGCHARGERVLLDCGREIAVENVVVGDRLLGVDGPRRVTWLHHGRQEMARIIPVKGDPFVVNLDHVLTLVWSASDGVAKRAGELVDVSVREWLTWSNNQKRLAKLLRVPGVWGFLDPDSYDLHPWLVGVFLGDGCLTNGVGIANSDEAVWAECQRLAPAHGVQAKRFDAGGKYRIALNNGPCGRSKNPVNEALLDLGLLGLSSGQKFVPDAYYHDGTRETRLEVLAGLLDTDGHLTCGGYDYVSKSPHLAQDVVNLARSVGLAAYMAPCQKYCQTGAGGTYYRVSISGDCSVVPCRVTRKQAPPRRQIKDACRTGFSVEVLPEDEYFGFEVDGDHRYLMADFTLTHNSGKSIIQLAAQAALAPLDAWILTPSLEIVRGFLEKLGEDVPSSEAAIAIAAARHRISTPIRFRNALLAGADAPDVIIYDEVHHAIGDTVAAGDLFGLCPAATWLGFTATPYRGSPRGTAALIADWGEPIVVLTVPEAIEAGYMARPTFTVEPLFDDDKLEVRNGEFVVVAAEQQLLGEVEALASLVADQRLGPTAVAVPSSNIAAELRSRLDLLGIRADWVNQATPARERGEAYERARAQESVLIDIATLTEGVDFPWLRTLIDAQPTLSPVRWMQRIGRIMRPKPERPAYICTNRNLERHAYLMQGGVPRRDVLAAMKAFGKPSNRLGKRVGLETLHKFKCVEIPTEHDGVALMYSLTSNDPETGRRVDRIVLIDAENTYCGEAVHSMDSKSKRVWGRYRPCDVWGDMAGFRSKSASGSPRTDVYPDNENLSVKQADWWKRSAARYGLDPTAVNEIDRRQFDALPALRELGIRLGE